MHAFMIKEFKAYIPEHDDDRLWGIWVVGAGSTGVPAHYSTYPASTHPEGYQYSWEQGRVFRDEHQVIYITRGRGAFESHETGRLDVEEGSVIFLFPGVWHRYRPSHATGWDAFFVSVKGELMDRLSSGGVISPQSPILRVGIDEELVRDYIRINDLAELQPLGFRPALSAGVMKILASVLALQQAHANENRHFDSVIQKARLRIIECVDQPLCMQELAREFHLSYAHFRRLFKIYTGFAPNHYHLELRLNRAKELLRNTNLPVKRICAMLGFSDPFHFSRFFKRRMGLSPRQWRQG